MSSSFRLIFTGVGACLKENIVFVKDNNKDIRYINSCYKEDDENFSSLPPTTQKNT